MLKSCVLALVGFSAFGADYHWTGNAGDGKWSSAGNWADSSGTAMTAAPISGTAYSYDFSSHADGQVVEQDVASVIAKSLTVGAGGLTIASAAGCKFSFKDGSNEVPVNLNDGATFWMKMDVSSDGNGQGINLCGTGTVYLDWPSACGAERKLNVNSAGVTLHLANAVAAKNLLIALNVRAQVVLDCDAFVKALFYEWGDDNHYGSAVTLNGHTMTIGAGYDQWNAQTSKHAYRSGDGCVKFAGQVVENYSTLPSGGTAVIENAAVTLSSPVGSFGLKASGETESPLRLLGATGYGLAAPNGMPETVTDAERGRVLKFDGTKYLCGAGVDRSLGLLPTGSKTPFTLAFWMKATSDTCPGNSRMFYWGDLDYNKCFGLQLLVANGSLFGATFHPANQPSLGHEIMWMGAEGVKIDDNAWHHVVVVYNGTATKVYVDAACIATNWNSNDAAPNISDRNFMLGGVMPDISGIWIGDQKNYVGLMDEIVLLQTALSDASVSDLKTLGATAFVGNTVLKINGAGRIDMPGDLTSMAAIAGPGLTGKIRTTATTIQVGKDAQAADSGTYSARLVSTAATPATFVKEGADYALAFDGTATNIGTVAVNAGTLTLRQPLARKGLLLYYPFEDETNVGADAGAFEYDLVTSGATPFTLVSDGVRGKAVHFTEGAKTCLISPSDRSLPAAFPKGNASFTFSVWVRPDAAAFARSVIFHAGQWTVDANLAMLGFNGATELQFSTDCGRDMNVAVPSLNDGKWHHIAVAYDAAAQEKRLFLDGALVQTKTLLALDLYDRNLCLGRFEYDAPDYFDFYSGDMDEFMLLNCAWTTAEAAAEYAGALPAAADATTVLPKPIAHWAFDDAENPGKDSSGNGCDLAVQGTASVVADEEADGNALSLDGNGYLAFASGKVPAIFPVGQNAGQTKQKLNYTVICRYRPKWESGTPSQFVLCWGNGNDDILSAGIGVKCTASLAELISGARTFTAGEDYQRAHSAADDQSWITVAIVYDTHGGFASDPERMVRWYVNGELKGTEAKGWVNIVDHNFFIGSFNNARNYKGLIDDVQLFSEALSDGEVRAITRTLSAHNGGLAPKCFATAPNVSVAAGATLKVSTSEPFGTLTGEGTVVVDRLATFSPASVADFKGTLENHGTVAYPAGQVFSVPDTATGLPVVSSAGAIALGAYTVFNVAQSDRGRFTLVHADGGIACDDLASFVVTGLPCAMKAKLVLVNGGRDLQLRVSSGFSLFVR